MKQSTLNDTLASHKLWLETKGKGGNRASLSCANLNGAYLAWASLTRAYIVRANLRGANLSRANLTGADLSYANLIDANLECADLYRANLAGANLAGANLAGANLADATRLPDVSWFEPGCLVRLNRIPYGFYLKNEIKNINFIQDSFGLIIKLNHEEENFDILINDRIIRGIPDWVKYSGLKKVYSADVG